jgi:hypothetical protein
LSSLGKRLFLMSNVHDDAPVVFETRWAMSYLRGPLTRNQIKGLMEARKTASAEPPATSSPTKRGAEQPAASAATRTNHAAPTAPPSVPPEIPSYFVPVRSQASQTASLIYQPALLANARVGFSDSKSGISVTRETTVVADITDGPLPVDWASVREAAVDVASLEKQPQEATEFGALPSAVVNPKKFAAFNKEFVNWAYGNQTLDLFKSTRFRQVSQPNESERDFRIRLQQFAREERDRAIEALKKKFAPKGQALQERIRRAQQAVEVQESQARQSQAQTAISFGATLLGAVFGRKTISVSSLGRATTAARGVGRSMKERGDVGRAQETVQALGEQLAELEAQFHSETAKLEALADTLSEALDTIVIKPKKTNISIALLALTWLPHWKDDAGNTTPAW